MYVKCNNNLLNTYLNIALFSALPRPAAMEQAAAPAASAVVNGGKRLLIHFGSIAVCILFIAGLFLAVPRSAAAQAAAASARVAVVNRGKRHLAAHFAGIVSYI